MPYNRQIPPIEESVKEVMQLSDKLCVESAKIAVKQSQGVYEIGTEFIMCRSALERKITDLLTTSYWRTRYQHEHHERLRLQRELASKE